MISKKYRIIKKITRRVKGGSGNTTNTQKNMAKNLVLGNPDLVNYMLEYAQIDVPFVVVLKYSDFNETVYGKGTKDNYKSEIEKSIYENQYEDFIENVVEDNSDKYPNINKNQILKILSREYDYHEDWEAKAFISGEWIDVEPSLDEIVELYLNRNKNSDNSDSS